jgi:hypothetical protein
MYETYPKKSANPSSSVGEQHTRSWNVSAKIDYPSEGGASATTYTGDRSHTKICKGGSGSKNKSDFPGNKYETFGTEKSGVS